jgi:hypothetical protein
MRNTRQHFLIMSRVYRYEELELGLDLAAAGA